LNCCGLCSSIAHLAGLLRLHYWNEFEIYVSNAVAKATRTFNTNVKSKNEYSFAVKMNLAIT
ncbi:MAG: hypothetical protein ACRDCT_23735, partial [Shewanella sp.]